MSTGKLDRQPPMATRAGATRLLTVPLAFHVLLAALAFASSVHPFGDFDRFWTIGSAAGRPYRDFPVEQTIGTVVVFRAVAFLFHSRAAFGIAIVCINVAADAALVGILLWGWGVGAALMFSWAVLPVLHLLLLRVDLWPMTASTLALACIVHKRERSAGAALAAGVAFKLWPIFFLPAVAFAGRRRVRAACLVALAAGLGVMAGAWWAMAGWHGLYQVVTFRGASGWQVESSVGSILALGRGLPPRMEAGAFRVGATNGWVAIALFLVAAPLALVWIWRGSAGAHIGAGWLAGIGTVLLLSALFSAQYVGWLLPGAAIAWSEGDDLAAMLASAAVLMTGLSWVTYGHVIDGAPAALAWIVARNTVVLAMVAVAARTTMRRAR
jgi:hypothetical protein